MGRGILAGMGMYDAVVLAGGGARRLGGVDKPGVAVGGRTLLDRVLGACEGAARTVVVGPRRATARRVLWARERPAGGGPVPALAAGLDALAGGEGAPVVVVLAADLPFLTSGTVGALTAALPEGYDGALLVDRAGRDQPLAAAYRAEALRREVALLRSEHGSLTGLPLRLLTGELALCRIPDPTGDAGFDCDTWEDVAVARARLDTPGG